MVLPTKVIKLYTIKRLQNRSWQSCSCSAVQFICQMFFPPTAELYSSVYKPYMQEEVSFINHTPQTKLNVWFSPSASQRRYPCSGSPAVYQDLNTSHDWPVKKGYCSIGKSKLFLSPLGVRQNKDLGAASQMLLARLRLHLQSRLLNVLMK